MGMAPRFNFLLHAFLCLALATTSFSLSPKFYDNLCPQALPAIKRIVEAAVHREPQMGASLLRLHFHDCFVNGCDGSLLLDSTSAFETEKNARGNFNSVRGFEVVDQIMVQVDRVCGRPVVSCADILAVAARDSVLALGGPTWKVRLGRRDSTTASRALADSVLPSASMDLPALISNFKNQGLNTRDLVALSGGHTIGLSQCVIFRNRIYNATNIDPAFAKERRATCPRTGGNTNLAPFDPTLARFDTAYFKNLVKERGLLTSDQALFSGGSTDKLVETYSKNPDAFWLLASEQSHFAQLSRLNNLDWMELSNLGCKNNKPTIKKTMEIGGHLAIDTNLSLLSSQRLDVAHPNHRLAEINPENIRIPTYAVSKRAGVGSKGARLVFPPVPGQVALRSLAKAGSISITHCDNQMVCPPERATRSFLFKPWFLKLLTNAGRSIDAEGSTLSANVLLAVVESLLPKRTFHVGPPSYNNLAYELISILDNKKIKVLNITATTESRAATAKISAQETTGRPQTLSTSALIWSTTSNPRTEFKFPRAFFSVSKEDAKLGDKHCDKSWEVRKSGGCKSQPKEGVKKEIGGGNHGLILMSEKSVRDNLNSMRVLEVFLEEIIEKELKKEKLKPPAASSQQPRLKTEAVNQTRNKQQNTTPTSSRLSHGFPHQFPSSRLPLVSSCSHRFFLISQLLSQCLSPSFACHQESSGGRCPQGAPHGNSDLTLYYTKLIFILLQGCDGSLLLDSTSSFETEKNARGNLNSVRGFEVVDQIKAEVDRVCGRPVVSCADILAVAARDSVVALGGPTWKVRLGRRDSTTASRTLADSVLPSASMDLPALVNNFKNQGLNKKDLVALSGGHTIGLSQCVIFRNRIYNATNIDPAFAKERRATCPRTGGNTNLAPFDPTPARFDTAYFKNLVKEKGLLTSDQALFSGGSTDKLVETYSKNPDAFWVDFGKSMIRMGNIKPLTGKQGQIRVNCRKVN
ncbi:hypothetical protein CXB51_023904 [Gossypium anomalum]|uniref:peroxidase n=1 Tax=Gossypium anomalum TaxID=47600 RepID=A0A8J5YFV3_9ROSI|nr:hypothetical protein CXB51_023904 [Gossypium anomalum]